MVDFCLETGIHTVHIFFHYQQGVGIVGFAYFTHVIPIQWLFNYVIFRIFRNIPKDSKYYIIEQPLDWDYVGEVCKTYNTDALLVMEKYVNRVNTRFQAEVDHILPDGSANYSY